LVEVVVAADAGRTEGAESAGEQRELGARERRERVVGGGPHWMGAGGRAPRAGGCGGKFGCLPKMGTAVGVLLELNFCPPALKIG